MKLVQVLSTIFALFLGANFTTTTAIADVVLKKPTNTNQTFKVFLGGKSPTFKVAPKKRPSQQKLRYRVIVTTKTLPPITHRVLNPETALIRRYCVGSVKTLNRINRDVEESHKHMDPNDRIGEKLNSLQVSDRNMRPGLDYKDCAYQLIVTAEHHQSWGVLVVRIAGGDYCLLGDTGEWCDKYFLEGNFDVGVAIHPKTLQQVEITNARAFVIK